MSESFSINTDPCFDETIVPQVSLEFNQAFRFFHIFIRDTMAVYKKEFFASEEGLKGGKQADEFNFNDFIENMDWWKKNTCGLLHGLMDKSWNMGKLGPEVRKRIYLVDNVNL